MNSQVFKQKFPFFGEIKMHFHFQPRAHDMTLPRVRTFFSKRYLHLSLVLWELVQEVLLKKNKWCLNFLPRDLLLQSPVSNSKNGRVKITTRSVIQPIHIEIENIPNLDRTEKKTLYHIFTCTRFIDLKVFDRRFSLTKYYEIQRTQHINQNRKDRKGNFAINSVNRYFALGCIFSVCCYFWVMLLKIDLLFLFLGKMIHIIFLRENWSLCTFFDRLFIKCLKRVGKQTLKKIFLLTSVFRRANFTP